MREINKKRGEKMAAEQTRASRILVRLMFMLLVLMIFTIAGAGAAYAANTAPVFTNGAAASVTVNENSGAADITDLLPVSDADAGQTETWSQTAAPQYGTLSITDATAASGGTAITAPTGSITYTPNSGYCGADSFTVQVSDGTDTAACTVSVTVQPGISVSPASLPYAIVSTPYNQSFCANGGSGPYTYAVTGGTLPDGISLSSSGTLSGTPAASGTFSFTVTATDSSASPGPYTGSASCTLMVNDASTSPADGNTPCITSSVYSVDDGNGLIGELQSDIVPVDTFKSDLSASPEGASFQVYTSDGSTLKTGCIVSGDKVKVSNNGSEKVYTVETYQLVDGERIYPGNVADMSLGGWPGDDAATGTAVPLGFNFNYFGNQFTNTYIDINGFISFNSLQIQQYDVLNYAGVFTRNSDPYNIIAAFLSDITMQNISEDKINNPQYVPSVYYKTIGVAPNRQFIAQWTNMYFWRGSIQFGDFQAILSEGSNKIQLQYRTLLDVDSPYYGVEHAGLGANATVGLKGPYDQSSPPVQVYYSIGGTDGTNQSILLHQGQAICFTPNGTGGYTMENNDALYEKVYLQNPLAPVASHINNAVGMTPDHAVGVSTNAKIGWEASDLADRYRLAVSKTDTFSNIVYNVDGITDTYFQFGGNYPLDYNTTYYWKVESINNNGSSFSPEYSFTTADSSNFTSFSLPGETGSAEINSAQGTIDVEVPAGTDVTGLTATFALSGLAQATVNGASQISGETSNNYSRPVDYQVTAADGSTKTWTVTVTEQAAAPTASLDNIQSGDTITSSYPVFSGKTNNKGQNVDIYLDDEKIGSTSSDYYKNWSFTPAAAIADGSHTLWVKVSDGNQSVQTAAITFTVATSGSTTIALASNPDSLVGDGSSTSTIEVQVQSNGTPLKGITVNLNVSAGSLAQTQVTTDDNGKAQVTMTAPRLSGIVPRQEYVTATVSTGDLNIQKSIAIQFMPASIQGVVVDNTQADHPPIAGARAELREDLDGDGVVDFTAETTTDSQGRYKIYVPEGNRTYTPIITIPVQVGQQTVSMQVSQQAEVGTLNGVGETINGNKNISGKLMVAQYDGSSLQEVSQVFAGSNISAALLDSNGGTVQGTVTVNSDGSYNIQNVPPGDYTVRFKVTAPDGEELAAQTAEVSVQQEGEVAVAVTLIDPYGIVTDQSTGQPVAGVNMQLYWAATANNVSQGRTADTLVNLPALANFPPDNNAVPQLTDSAGEYAWMVIPNSDYYIIAEKDGYQKYDSRVEKRNVAAQAGEDSWISDGIIHIGQSIVNYNLQLQPLTTHHSGGGSSNSSTAGISVADITVTNNPAGTSDTVDVAGVSAGEVVRVYDAAGNVLGTATVAAGKTETEVTVTQLGTGSGSIYVTATRAGQSESSKTAKPYAAEVVAQPATPVNNPQSSFTDINGHWAQKIIEEMAAKNIVSGIGDGKFDPDGPVTRAEVSMILDKAFNLPPKSGSDIVFNDTGNAWYSQAVDTATRSRLMKGYGDGTFKPDQLISRQEMVVVINNIFNYQGRTTNLNDSETENALQDFGDQSKIRPWAREAVAAAAKNGIVKGSNGMFNPEQSCTRAEATVIIYNLLNTY